MWPFFFFFNPTIKLVTFRLHGWCMLGVFLLPAFTRLGHERQDLLSLCDEMHACTDLTSVYTLIRKSFWEMEFEPMLTPREKSPVPENFPRGGSNPWCCGQRAWTLPRSYSGPHTFIDIVSFFFIVNMKVCIVFRLSGMQGLSTQAQTSTTTTSTPSTTATSPTGDATTTTTTTASNPASPAQPTSTTTTTSSSATGTTGTPTLAPQMGSQEAFSNMMSQLMGMMVGGQIVSGADDAFDPYE